eukprot:4749923-Amphidinium_carterae.1
MLRIQQNVSIHRLVLPAYTVAVQEISLELGDTVSTYGDLRARLDQLHTKFAEQAAGLFDPESMPHVSLVVPRLLAKEVFAVTRCLALSILVWSINYQYLGRRKIQPDDF